MRLGDRKIIKHNEGNMVEGRKEAKDTVIFLLCYVLFGLKNIKFVSIYRQQ